MQNLKKPKAIIFDWDNTLVDTWPLIQTAIDTTMQAMNREVWGLEKVRDNVHKSMRESFPAIFGDDWKKAGEIYKETYQKINVNSLRFLPSARELIDAISQAEILQFIVSNKIGATLRKEAEVLGVDKKFFMLVGSGDASDDKPSRKPVEFALIGSDLELQKDEIWFIGDTIADVDCALNCGCTPIVYGHKDHGISKTIPEKMIAEKNLAVYFDHADLIKIIKNYG